MVRLVPGRSAGRHLIAFALTACCAVGFVLAFAGPASAAVPGQTGPFAADTLGGAGPCGVSQRTIASPASTADTQLSVYILTPTGTAGTPLLGGTCNSAKRPTIFFAHGFGLGSPSDYDAFLTHLVSIGNIVVEADYDSGSLSLPTTFVQVDQGSAAAPAAEPRIDTTRVGFHSHSHGGGMMPYLVQRAAARGWGANALFMTSFEQAYTQMQGTGGPIRLPSRTKAFFINGDDDLFTDTRNSIDVFRSVTLPAANKRHIVVHSDAHGLPWLDAGHAITTDGTSAVDALDYNVWRLSDILETCAVSGQNCSADLTYAGRWSDGAPIRPNTVSANPVDGGPIPALLAECNSVLAWTLNPRIFACGPSRL